MIKNFKEYQAWQKVNEALEDFMDMDHPDTQDVIELTQTQDDILSKYDLSQSEIDNIKSKIEDTIKMKLGVVD